MKMMNYKKNSRRCGNFFVQPNQYWEVVFGGANTFNNSSRDFVTVAVTPNFDNLEAIFLKSTSLPIPTTYPHIILFTTYK